jgi:hypothetical protein
MFRSLLLVAALLTGLSASAFATPKEITNAPFDDRFRQLEEDWPTPTRERPATGAPGPAYWQQKVDYRMSARLDETRRRISGTARITYRNNSPDRLEWLWLLLDQNNFKATSTAAMTQTVTDTGRIGFSAARRALAARDFDGGFQDLVVTDDRGAPLRFVVNDTLMRVDLPRAIEPGGTVTFNVSFAFNLVDGRVLGGRSGYECFTEKTENGDCIFLAAQWFPRLAAYSDYEGWHNKQFLGAGEFTLEFGDYDVSLTVPDDHVVSSTGELANPDAVLSGTQKQRFAAAKASDKPVYIVTPEEAAANEKSPATGEKIWNFRARNVRDFAFASSRKFIWDGMGVSQPGVGGTPTRIMAMSFYPNEAEPLWSAYSTKSIAHTLKVYSRFSFDYPYPTAQSVNGPVGGMEYPMITFNGPRPVRDAEGNITYSERTKYGLVTVVIHEVGHIYFPMIVNSDERQWTWMDEGVNTFLQFLAEREWEEKYPSSRGDPVNVADHMKSDNQTPLMTQSDSTLQFGASQYGKAATGLVILRETIMGREAFDHAFKAYANRWRFKRPTPYDFFRTMEEASGTDLDWFWRGWFYSTDVVDQSLEKVVRGTLDSGDPDTEAARRKAERDALPGSLTEQRNKAEGIPFAATNDPSIVDFYTETDPLEPTKKTRDAAKARREGLTDWQRAIQDDKRNFYFLTVVNKGIVMPVIARFTYDDGTTEIVRIPAEVWRRNAERVTVMHVTPKVAAAVELDPLRELPDVNRDDNAFPQRIVPSRLEIFEDAVRSSNRLQDNELTVTPGSIETQPAKKPAPKQDPK